MRRRLAFAMALAVALTSVPANGLTGYAEEATENVEAEEVLDEIVSEDGSDVADAGDTLESMDTEAAEEPVEQQTETGEQAFIESVEVVAEEAANPEETGSESEELKVAPKEEVTLDSGKQAAEGETLNYKWYDLTNDPGQSVEISDAANKPSYTLTVDHNKRIRCEVTKDGQVIFTKEFIVTVNTGLEIERDYDYEDYGYDAEREVWLNESVILQPEVTVAEGVGLHYQWYKKNAGEEYTLIDGADKEEYTIVADLNTADYYRLVVTDDYGNEKDWVCKVMVQTLKFDGGDEDYVVLKPETGTVLQVMAESVVPNAKLSYQWSKYNDTKESWDSLENASAATLEIGAVKGSYEEYECLVSDGFARKTKTFYVSVNTGFEVRAEQDEVLVKAGEAATLRVIASSNYSDKYPITYQWYSSIDDRKIEGATGASYTVPPVITPDRRDYGYYCKVSDQFTNETIYFDVIIDTGLSVSANNVWVAAGSAAELKVEASTEDAYGPLKYEWMVLSEDEYWKQIANDGSTYVVANVQGLQKYRCVVSDKLASEEVDIQVGLLNDRDTYALDFESARVLKAGEENTATIIKPGAAAYFKFVPERSGEWKLYSQSDKDTRAYLYDSERNELAENDDDSHEGTNNFGISCRLVQGRTYYLKCTYYYDEVSDKGSYKVLAKFVEDGKSEHKWKEVRVTKAPGCETEGRKSWSCEMCGEKFTEELLALGHAYPETWTVRKAATCLEDGVEYRTCSRCGKEETRAIKAVGAHQFGAYVVTKQPTVLETGIQTRTCAVCHATESAEIARLSGVIHLTTKKIPLQVKKNVQLSRILKDLAAGDSIASCVSSKPKVATVDNSGKVVGKSAGKTNVTITLASGVSDTVTIVVQKKKVAASGISNVSKSLKLKLGEKYTLAPVISPITTADKASYSSSNKKVVTVSKKGVITAKKSGTAKITVKAGKKKVTVKVTVEKVAPTGMNKVPESKTLKKGKSFTIKPKLTPSGAEAKITYRSSNKKVATVNAKGKVTAKKKGTATITVKAGNVIRTCVVTVK